MPLEQWDGADAHSLPADAVVVKLASDERRGVDPEEARNRLAQFGRNELRAEQPVAAWRKFVAQFYDPLVALLLAATAVSFSLWVVERDSALPYEAIAIFAIVLLNAILSFVQQARAERAVAALRKMSAAKAHVIRGGERQHVPAAELVPGDVILVEEGDTVPADARLLRCHALQTAEAALTGESLPAAKDLESVALAAPVGDRTDMIFSGTSVTYGRGVAVITATGMRTQLGRIAGLLATTPDEITPLQKELAKVGRNLGLVVVAIAIGMIATILLIADVRGLAALFDVLILGVALAVAAVPEGLPAVVTGVLALGVQRMAQRNAIVRHLSAVETLGSASVIASDKTGTLTKNEMTVRTVVTASGRVDFGGHGYFPTGEVQRSGGGAVDGDLRLELTRALAAGDLANNAVLNNDGDRWTVQGDPTEGALIVAAQKAGLTGDVLATRFERVGEVPFSSDRKLMSTVHSDAKREETLLAFTKGAPDVLLTRCTMEQVGGDRRPLTAERRRQIHEANDSLAADALRTLAVALRLLPRADFSADEIGAELEQELVFLGLIGMIDPPREETKTAVRRAKEAGIRPLMITGDHPVTAAVIARELGIAGTEPVLGGADIEAMSDEALAAAVTKSNVYARVNPEHKLRIVAALKRHGAIVAMTGDGVNDAPALKAADIGVAMGITGTDVSKEAADIVLADDNFASIVAAVEEGRAIFGNIRKFLRYLLSSNIGEVLTMFLGVVLGGLIGLPAGAGAVTLPLLATQILWINLVTDGLPALALGVDPPDPDVMQRAPRPAGEGVITAAMWRGIAFIGVVFAAGTLLVTDLSLPGGLIEGSGDLRYAQTMAFTTLVLFSLFNVLNARSDERSAFTGLFTNAWLWGAIAVSVALQLAVVYVPFLRQAFSTTPLSPTDWLVCAFVGSSVVWLRECTKVVARLRRTS